MFIKKDRRRIEEIFQDSTDEKTSLNLAKRFAEFQGSVRCLCKDIYVESLQNLKTLNLYDNALTNVVGIHFLSQTPIEEINLGGNKLTELPLEVICFAVSTLIIRLTSFLVWNDKVASNRLAG